MATGLKTYLVLEDAACLDVERADDVRVTVSNRQPERGAISPLLAASGTRHPFSFAAVAVAAETDVLAQISVVLESTGVGVVPRILVNVEYDNIPERR